MTTLSNKTILLTGATGGFGQHFVRQLLARNNALIVTDLDGARLEAVANQIYTEVGRGELVACIASDLSSQDGAQKLVEAVMGLNRSIDMLINNAGLGLMGRHDEVPTDDWERLMQVNLLAPMRLCGLLAPQMIARRSGHIVNIASLAAWTPDVGLSAYAASKFGLRGFSEALGDELRPHNVQVSAVHPFYSDTPIIDSPRYGSLGVGNSAEEVDRSNLTDPADIVKNTLVALEKDKADIFPDKIGAFIYRLKRYAPPLFNVLRRRYSKVNQSGAD